MNLLVNPSFVDEAISFVGYSRYSCTRSIPKYMYNFVSLDGILWRFQDEAKHNHLGDTGLTVRRNTRNSLSKLYLVE